VVSLVNTIPQAFLEVLHHSLQHVGRNCCHFFPDVLFQIHRCPWFLFVHLALEISSEEKVLRLGTLVPMNIEVPKKYPLSQERIIVFKIRLHSKSPMLYRPALHGNWNPLSLARRALKDKFPTPTVPLKSVLQNRQVFFFFAGPCISLVSNMSTANPQGLFRELRTFSYLSILRDSANNCLSVVTSTAASNAFLCCCHE